MLIRLALVVMLCTLLCSNSVFAFDDKGIEFKEEKIAKAIPMVPNIVEINVFDDMEIITSPTMNLCFWLLELYLK